MGSKSTTRTIASLAAAQRGVVTHHQLRAAGVSKHVKARLLAQGWLHDVFPHVVAVGHPALTPLGRCLAATLSTDGVLSHRAAAWLWGIAALPDAPEVTVPRRCVRPTIVVHQGTLTRAQVTRRQGVRCTTLPKTVVDLAAVLAPRGLLDVFEEAQVQHRLRPVDVAQELLLHGGHRGTARLAKVVDDAVEPGQVESRLELIFLKVCRDFGLPRPVTQVRIGPWRVDFLFPEWGVVVETDSRRFHSTLRRRRRDAAKTADLEARGFAVVRTTWRALTRDPGAVVGEVVGARERASRANGPLAGPFRRLA